MATKQTTIDLVIKSKLQGVPDIKKVSDAVDALSNSVNNQTKVVVNNVDAFDKLKNTRNQLSNVASEVAELNKLTSAFEKSKVSVQENTDKLAQQQAQLTQLSAQIAKSNTVSQTKIDKEAALTRAIEKTKQAIESEKKSQSELSALLAKAGIDTNNYAAALDKLRNITNQVSGAMSNARNKINDVNTSQANGVKLQRTSLDLYQRIRGQVLSITAGYFGVYGALNLVNDAMRVYDLRQSAINQLTVATKGDLKAAGDEYAYVAEQAERLGINFETALKGYAKFNISASLAGRPMRENRFIFESVSELGKVAGLSAEQLDRVFFAISQIDSKGRVMAEEFNSQLGDAIPGLTGVAKQATVGMFDDFTKAMKDGKVSLEVFAGIMAKYRELIQGQLPGAINTAQAAQERLNKAIFDFKLQLAESGAYEEYKLIIQELTDFFRSPDGADFAKNLANAFRLVGTVLRFLIDNFETLSIVLSGYVGMKFLSGVIKELIYFRSLLKSTPALLGSVIATLKKYGTRLAIFGRGGIIGLIFFGTITIAELLYEQFPAVKTAVDELVKMLNLDFGGSFEKTAKQAALRVKKYAQIMVETSKLQRGLITPDQYDKNVKGINQAFATESKSLWAPAKKGVTAASKTPAKKGDTAIQSEIDFYKSQMGKGLTTGPSDTEVEKTKKKIDSIAESLLELEQRVKKSTSDSLDEKVKAIDTEFVRLDKDIQTITNKRIRNAFADRLKTAKELLKKEVVDDFVKTVGDSLQTLENKVQTKAAETLVQKVNAVDQEFFKLERQIEQITDERVRSEYSGRLVRAREQMKVEIIQEYQKKLLDSKKALEQDILNAEAETGRKSKLDLDKRLAAVDQKYADSFKKIAEQRKALLEANMADPTLDDQENRLVIAVKENKELETRKFYLEEAARLEKQVTDLVQARDARLRSVEIQKDTKALTELQALQETAKVVSSTQPGIEKAAQAFRDFVAANEGSFGPESQAQLQEYKNKVEELAASNIKLRTQILTVQDVNERFAQGATDSFEALADGIGGAITGANSLGDAFENTAITFGKFVAQFLRDVGLMIAKQALLNAIQNSSFGSRGGFAGILVNAVSSVLGGGVGTPGFAGGSSVVPGGGVSAFIKHSGGVVGGVGNRTRSVPPAMFTNAPRYHSGGIAGLKPDEYATILQKNEEVLTSSDPRNILNGGGTSGQQVNFNPTNIVAIDTADIQNAAFGSGAEQKLLNMIALNPSKYRTAMKL